MDGLFDDLDVYDKTKENDGVRDCIKEEGGDRFVSKKVYFATIMVILIVCVLGKLIWGKLEEARQRTSTAPSSKSEEESEKLE